MNLEKIIYSLNIEDVQKVAGEEIGRELTKEEVDRIVDTIGSNINWYDAIADAISSGIKDKSTDS